MAQGYAEKESRMKPFEKMGRSGVSAAFTRLGIGRAAVLSLLLFAIAFASHAQVPGAELRRIVAAGEFAELHWPNFSDYAAHVRKFYDATGYADAWTKGGVPTPQAIAIIAALNQASAKGLDAEDYDGSRWTSRIAGLRNTHSEAAADRFDAALTISAMRYISDLHIGKVNPRFFHFGLDIEHKKYDLADFLRQQLVDAPDVRVVLLEVEPPYAGYQRTQAALDPYLELSSQPEAEPLPVPSKAVKPGGAYDALGALAQRLRLLGDLPAGAALPDGTRENAREAVRENPPDDASIYTGPLVAAVKHFQERHGLAPDGVLGAQTIAAINVPLARRVRQLQLALERWRWVPHDFAEPPVVVNIPEFRLRAFDQDGSVALAMNVVVGKAYDHETPVFSDNIRYVVLRPYWNVPASIARSELIPKISKNHAYLQKERLEVITPDGTVVTDGVVSDDVLARLRSSALMIRQKPGPKNSLGLVKIIFPNDYSVYLHDTPQSQLFSQSRRDFSHGCIRVEKPAELAAWVLRRNSAWPLAKVKAAMQSGAENQQVNVTPAIPVLIFYATAIVTPSGDVHFFDDIYGYDAELEKTLAKGYPYPG
jgi:L,D-transpeptidase YcbB